MEGTLFHPKYPFVNFLEASPMDDRLAHLLEKKLDAIWVRARLKAIFGVDSAPEGVRIEKSFSSFFVLATAETPSNASIKIPFECSDHYGRTSLFFSPNEVDSSLTESVATSFWQLVTDEVTLSDFEDKAFHLGVGVWMYFGCKDGQPFYSEKDNGYFEEYDENQGAG
jgi:hypothetical protein